MANKTTSLAPLLSFPIDHVTARNFLEAMRKEKEEELRRSCQQEEEPIEKCDGVEGDTADTFVDRSLVAKKKRDIEEIDNALLRLEEGSFGICATCEEEISPKRLRVTNLLAIHCIDCQKQLEQKEPHQRKFIPTEQHYHGRKSL